MVLILANLLASYHLLLAPGDEKEMGTQVLILTIFLPDLFCTVPYRVPELPEVRQARYCPRWEEWMNLVKCYDIF
jgi:hypothetical protein